MRTKDLAILDQFAKAPIVRSFRIPGGKKFFKVGQVYVCKRNERLWEGFEGTRNPKPKNCSWKRMVGPAIIDNVSKGTKILCLSKPRWLCVGHPQNRIAESTYVKKDGKLVTLVYRKYVIKVLVNEKVSWMLFSTDESPTVALRRLK